MPLGGGGRVHPAQGEARWQEQSEDAEEDEVAPSEGQGGCPMLNRTLGHATPPLLNFLAGCWRWNVSRLEEGGPSFELGALGGPSAWNTPPKESTLLGGTANSTVWEG